MDTMQFACLSPVFGCRAQKRDGMDLEGQKVNLGLGQNGYLQIACKDKAGELVLRGKPLFF
jgi:hypothetical protein